LVRSDANSSVIQVNTNVLTDMAATEENTPTGLGVFDGVANQVAQNSAEKQRIAVYCGGGRNRPNANSRFQSRNLILMTSSSKQGLKWNRRQRYSLGVLAEPDSGE
jgi:hypothetical protein